MKKWKEHIWWFLLLRLLCHVAGLLIPNIAAKCLQVLTLKARIPAVNLLTSWSRVLLEKVTGSQLVKKYPTLYGTRRFITAFTSAHHLSLSWVLNIMIMISGSQSPWHGASSGCRWRNSLQYGGYLWTYWISGRGQPTQGGAPQWGLGEVLTTPFCKNVSCCKPFTKTSDLDLILDINTRGNKYCKEQCVVIFCRYCQRTFNFRYIWDMELSCSCGI
jgi:hypothetical protein